MSQLKEKLPGCVTLIYLIGTMALAASVAAGETEKDCANSFAIELDTTLRGSGPRCFEAHLPFPGKLWVDVSVPGSAEVEARLDVFGRVCGDGRNGGQEYAYVERFATGALLDIRAPGVYLFCVAAQDPRLVLGDYKLTNAFVGEFDVKSGDPYEYLPDPDPLVFGCYLKEGDPDEYQPDPDPLGAGCAQSAHSPLSRREILQMCSERGGDDHGESSLCASILEPGQVIAGEIGNDWGDDADQFSFVLTEPRTVEITTFGETDTFGSLYDRFGHRLAAAAGGGEGANVRIVKTLGPGWYFVKVEGYDHSESSYRLSVDFASR